MDRLDGVHPVLRAKIEMIMVAMRAIGHPVVPVQGVRTAEYQHKLWQQGRETPGDIVTDKDGYTSKSNHQVKDDGFGHAVDCCFEGPEPWGEHQPWDAYGALREALGLAWGGRWKRPHDRPHLELR